MKAPNREEPHTDKEIWDERERWKKADRQKYGQRMFVAGLLVSIFVFWLGYTIGLIMGGF